MTEASKLFGFVQFDLAGALPLADGRYVVRDDGEETVLVTETLGAPTPPRRRRRPRRVEPVSTPTTVPLTRATVVLATWPFPGEDAASEWLRGIVGDEQALDALLAQSAALLNRALYVHAVVSEDPHQAAISLERTAAARIGFGSGEQVASGEWIRASVVDTSPARSRRQQRTQQLGPQERIAAILGDREQLDICETLILRARADLDAGRPREAALQLRIGLDALLTELPGALDDPMHGEDIAALEARRDEAAAAADSAIQGELTATQLTSVTEVLGLCERVLRRRRVLGG